MFVSPSTLTLSTSSSVGVFDACEDCAYVQVKGQIQRSSAISLSMIGSLKENGNPGIFYTRSIFTLHFLLQFH